MRQPRTVQRVRMVTLVAGALFFGVFAPLSASSAAVAHVRVGTPAIGVSPSSGAPGAPVTITGSGWMPSTRISISFRDANGVRTLVGSAKADGTGAFTANVNVPANAAIGVGRFNGKDRSSGQHANIRFKVT